MKRPNLASKYHCGQGRWSSDSHFGSYLASCETDWGGKSGKVKAKTQTRPVYRFMVEQLLPNDSFWAKQ
jgi:hypothetical protein